MREFFKTWRRKIGVAALVVACLFMVLWVRAIYSVEEIVFKNYISAKAIISSPGGITYERRRFFDGYVQKEYLPTEIFTIPYQSLVGYPVLLSAWLLLIKPRSKPKAQPDRQREA